MAVGEAGKLTATLTIPEYARGSVFAIPQSVMPPDHRAIKPGGMLYQPPGHIVKPALLFIEGAHPDTYRAAGTSDFIPVFPTFLRRQWPFNHAGIIGNTGHLGRRLSTPNSPRGASLNTFITDGAELGYAKFNRFIRLERQIGDYLAQSLAWAEQGADK